MHNSPVTHVPTIAPNWLQRTERRLVDRMAERHLARLGGAQPGSRGVTLGWRLLSLLLALPVHAVSVASAGGGLSLLVTGDHWPMRLLGGLLLLFAFCTRPTVDRRPEDASRLQRTDAPNLFALVDAVARTNGARTPDEILVVDTFNAFAAHVGWRRRRVLGLGAPLWVAASPQARVALLGHELGHFAHGDLTHGWWVGTAEQTLLHWLDITEGTHHVVYDEVHLVERYLMAPLRGIIMGYLFLLACLNAPAHQRQEYLADLDAARAAGTDGALEMLDVLVREPTATTAITRAAVSPGRPDLWAELSADLADLTEQDLERLRAHAATDSSRIDDTHPATALRVRLLRGRPPEAPAVVLDPDVQDAVDAELAPALALAAKEAGERVRFQY